SLNPPSRPISCGAVAASRPSASGNGMVSRHGVVGCAGRTLGTASWEELAGCSDGRAATHRSWGTSSLARNDGSCATRTV
ncbi:Os04g0343900, partial [Oryza sativa Japonica Group]